MRIALVHYSYPPIVGGVENVVAAHARLFAEAGHEVTVLCRRGASADPRIRVELLPEGADGLRILPAVLAQQEVVFLHNVCTMPFDRALTETLWKIGRTQANVRFICWVHDLAAGNPEYARDAETSWALLSQAHERFEYVAISEQRARQMQKLTGVVPRVIPNGVDAVEVLGLTGLAATLTNQFDLLTRDVVLLHPARLLRRKRIELSLKVVAALKKSGRTTALIVTAAADPHHAPARAYGEELLALREQLGVQEEAIFLNQDAHVTGSDLAGLYQIADALLFPSAEEGFGLPLLEAALHRLLIFCTDLPPLNTLVIPGRHLFPPEMESGKLAAMIAEKIDADSAAQARKAAARDSAWRVIYRKFLAPLLAEQ